MAEALQMLEFAELKEGALKLTAAGRVFAQSGHEECKGLFKEHLLRFVPFVPHIQLMLEEREGRSAPRVRFKSELEDHVSPQDAERTLRTAIGWGRYAEVRRTTTTAESSRRIIPQDERRPQKWCKHHLAQSIQICAISVHLRSSAAYTFNRQKLAITR